MTKNIWVISDTHFQHENILKFEPNRPGSSIQEHDDILVDNWNSVVEPGDKVYHLGDVFMGKRETFPKLWSRLNGKKRLVMGNHDDGKYLASGAFFEKVVLWRIFDSLLLTHVPVHQSSLKEGGFTHGVGWINVHGHTHSNGSPEGPYTSACVELINYTPINLEELRDKKQKEHSEDPMFGQDERS